VLILSCVDKIQTSTTWNTSRRTHWWRKSSWEKSRRNFQFMLSLL